MALAGVGGQGHPSAGLLPPIPGKKPRYPLWKNICGPEGQSGDIQLR